MIAYLTKQTNVQKIAQAPWKKVVDEVILPRLAGTPAQRYRIAPPFMKFMALYGEECYQKDAKLGEILYEIALQRISNGAVLHQADPTPTFQALPAEYKAYASQNGYLGCEPGLMGEEEEAFLRSRLENCAMLPALRFHALAICFGIVENLFPDGKEDNGYMLESCYYKPDGAALYALAEKIIRNYATDEEIFRHWAIPKQWKKHFSYFAGTLKAGKFSYEDFFAATGADGEGNMLKKWWNRRKVKRDFSRVLPEGTVAAGR